MTDKATVVFANDRLTTDRIVGQTVDEVRDAFQQVFNIPSDATASVNSEPVDDDYMLEAGDQLVFARPAGRKG